MKIYTATSAVIFLGTPHRGSDITDWGIIFTRMATVAPMGSNRSLLQSLLPNGEFLSIVRDEFSKMLKDIKIHSFQEARTISGLLGFDFKVCLALHSTIIFIYKHSINTLLYNLLGC